jgi:hypothetical protein
MISNLPMKDVTNFRVRGIVEKVALLLLDTLDNGLVEVLEIQTSVVAPGPRCDQRHRLVEQHLESRSRRLHPEVDVTQHVLDAPVNNKQKPFKKFYFMQTFKNILQDLITNQGFCNFQYFQCFFYLEPSSTLLMC